MRNLLATLSGVMVLTGPALAQPFNADPAGHSLIFNTAYTVDDGTTLTNHVRIGSYTFTEDPVVPDTGTVTMVFWDYNGSANYASTAATIPGSNPPQPLNHPLAPDTPPTNCAPNPFEYMGQAVTFDSTQPTTVVVTYTYSHVTGILDINIDNDMVHRWVLREDGNEFFELGADFFHTDNGAPRNAFTDDVTGVHANKSVTYSNSLGMGYLSDNARTNVHVRADNLLHQYNWRGYASSGEEDGVNSHPWLYLDSGITKPKAPNDPTRDINDFFDDPNAIAYAGSTGTTHSTTAFGLSSIRNVFHMHGGHYTGAGYPCYNQTATNPDGSGGHVRTFWGVWNTHINDEHYDIVKGIGIEYSPQASENPPVNGHRPILSIFRFDDQT